MNSGIWPLVEQVRNHLAALKTFMLKSFVLKTRNIEY